MQSISCIFVYSSIEMRMIVSALRLITESISKGLKMQFPRHLGVHTASEFAQMIATCFETTHSKQSQFKIINHNQNT